MAEELRLRDEVPSRIERKVYREPEQVVSNAEHNRPSLVNAMFMICFAIIFDAISLAPGANDITIFVANLIFIPWFYMSGVKFTNKRITSLGVTTIIEAIPFLGAFPMITVNVIYSLYYSD
jgi:hypothetical protein